MEKKSKEENLQTNDEISTKLLTSKYEMIGGAMKKYPDLKKPYRFQYFCCLSGNSHNFSIQWV